MQLKGGANHGGPRSPLTRLAVRKIGDEKSCLVHFVPIEACLLILTRTAIVGGLIRLDHLAERVNPAWAGRPLLTLPHPRDWGLRAGLYLRTVDNLYPLAQRRTFDGLAERLPTGQWVRLHQSILAQERWIAVYDPSERRYGVRIRDSKGKTHIEMVQASVRRNRELGRDEPDGGGDRDPSDSDD